MALKVYNTMSGKKEEFIPLEDKKVGMYVCGPTVYDDCHIGHARAYISFDVIYRYLRFLGYDVTYVRNITDVDDKIINKANSLGKDFREITQVYSDSFHKDMIALGLLKPNLEPNASEHIKEIKKIVRELLKKRFAYKSGGDVYYSVDQFKGYGKLSKREIEDMKAGARVEVSEVKKNPLDFALWKNAKEGEPSWNSPWGKGRPGWHIECSAMSSKYLGESLDIHAGGRDLIFPHHENEIAQSEAYTGKPFVKYWLHNGFVNISKEKMSKSLGNIITIKHLLSKFSTDAIKLFILSSHYRSPIDFSEDLIAESEKACGRVYTLYKETQGLPKVKGTNKFDDEFHVKFRESMDDDFNTAKAIGTFFDYVNKGFVFLESLAKTKSDDEKKKLKDELSILISGLNFISTQLGLFEERFEPESYFHRQRVSDEGRERIMEIERLISEREELRRKREWVKADELRKTLREKYEVELEDKKDKTEWKFIK